MPKENDNKKYYNPPKHDGQDTNGYFLIKLRTNKTKYTKNFNDYLNNLNNFNIMVKINYNVKKNKDFFKNGQNKKRPKQYI